MSLLRSPSVVLIATLATVAPACGGRADDTGSPSPAVTGNPPPVAPAPATCVAGAADIAVSSTDLNGFPPYAASGCSLVYVSSNGDLVVRDLASLAETVLAPKSEHPRRPTASAQLIAWEADLAGRAVVRVRKTGGDTTTILTSSAGAFAASGEPRASGGSVAFTVWNGPAPTDDTDVWLYDAATDTTTLAIGGPGQQRFSDVSAKYVVASDFSEDTDKRFDNDGKDLSDIIVLDRASGILTTRRAPGKQAFPMITQVGSDDVLAYLAWSGIHPEPKLTAYQLRGGPMLGDPAADKTIADVSYLSSDYARPAAVAGTIEWIANPNGRTILYRAPADGSAPPVAVNGLEDLHLYAPAPSSGGFTVVATLRATASSGTPEAVPRLRAVSR